jgi:hypothetical protein
MLYTYIHACMHTDTSPEMRVLMRFMLSSSFVYVYIHIYMHTYIHRHLAGDASINALHVVLVLFCAWVLGLIGFRVLGLGCSVSGPGCASLGFSIFAACVCVCARERGRARESRVEHVRSAHCLGSLD